MHTAGATIAGCWAHAQRVRPYWRALSAGRRTSTHDRKFRCLISSGVTHTRGGRPPWPAESVNIIRTALSCSECQALLGASDMPTYALHTPRVRACSSVSPSAALPHDHLCSFHRHRRPAGCSADLSAGSGMNGAWIPVRAGFGCDGLDALQHKITPENGRTASDVLHLLAVRPDLRPVYVTHDRETLGGKHVLCSGGHALPCPQR